jgi:WD40 repeat protein
MVDPGGFVASLAFSADGMVLATGGAAGVIRLWDPLTGDEVRLSLRGHTDAVEEVAFAHVGRLLATASCDGTACLWDLPIDAAMLRTQATDLLDQLVKLRRQHNQRRRELEPASSVSLDVSAKQADLHGETDSRDVVG